MSCAIVLCYITILSYTIPLSGEELQSAAGVFDQVEEAQLPRGFVFQLAAMGW